MFARLAPAQVRFNSPVGGRRSPRIFAFLLRRALSWRLIADIPPLSMAPPLPPALEALPLACAGSLAPPPRSVVSPRPAAARPCTLPLDTDAAFWQEHDEISSLGRGCFGSVLLVRSRGTGEALAAKVQVVGCADVGAPSVDCYREVRLLDAAKHENVCQLVRVYETPTTLFILMRAELGGDLQPHALPGGTVGEREARRHMRGLLAAVAHIHRLRIVHRDIKPSNVLLSAEGEVRLADFGLAAELPLEGDGLLTKVCGTHDYLAPEMVRCGHGECEGYGTPVDLWAVGLLLFSLLCGSNPFERENDIDTLQAILLFDGQLAFPPTSSVSAPARELICALLSPDPARRATASESLGFSWLSEPTKLGTGAMPEPQAGDAPASPVRAEQPADI